VENVIGSAQKAAPRISCTVQLNYHSITITTVSVRRINGDRKLGQNKGAMADKNPKIDTRTDFSDK
jgi:hypothetical protein